MSNTYDLLRWCVVAVLFAVTVPAWAIDTVTGTLDGLDPTYDRVYSVTTSLNCDATSIDSGQDGISYDVIPFVTTGGEALEATVVDGGTTILDTVLFVYCDPFDPANPDLNLVAWDDDDAGNGLSEFTVADGLTLTPNTQYYMVIAGYFPGMFGNWQIDFGGTYEAGTPISGTADVAIYGGDLTDGITDVQAKLVGTGLFGVVDTFEVTTNPIPTLADLQNYDAVLVYNEYLFSDPVGMGDVLADYLDWGGGVVLAVAGYHTTFGINGRFQTDGYMAFATSSTVLYPPVPPVMVVDNPASPILDGVVSFTGTAGFSIHDTTITPGAGLVASWDDGNPLIATYEPPASAGRTVGLNFMSPSSDASILQAWDATTDGDLIMGNSLIWAANPGNDTDGDGVDDDDDNCPTTANPLQENSDGDTLGDACDNCPLDDNETQDNVDSDLWGDVCDNCPDHPNDGQEDTDNGGAGDGIGDACCFDWDGDGWGDDTMVFTDCPDNLDGDCDDSDNLTYPGASEQCDGLDNNCDGLIPNGQPDGEVDDDGDGEFECEGDCDDAEPAINTSAAEVCDHLDNNCDGDVDEGLPTETFYPDADGDTYGDANDPGVVDCMIPSGYVYDNQDCDDTDAAVNPLATEVCDGVDNDCDGFVDLGASDESDWYADTDGDTYGDAADMVTACFAPSGYVADSTDCDDTDAAVNPGATEFCNGIDDDCNGLIDDGVTYHDFYPDTDGDTYGDINGTPVNDCAPPPGYVLDATDCDDTNAAVNPGATELCNGVDDDCNGLVDDGLILVDYWPDTDGDTFGDDSVGATSACDPPSGYVTNNGDCNDTDAAINPAAAEVCDGVDNDCDGTVDVGATDALTWYADADGDGYGDAASTTTACTLPTGYSADATDCDDTAAAINPGMPEICNNGIDDDCDPATDETVDDDGDGFSECDGDCDDGDAAVHPSAVEVCDGIDNDCNPLTDEDVDDDGDGETECQGDCNDNNDTVYSTAAEICDGVDNNCDGSLGVDEVDTDGDGSFLCDVPPDCDDNDNLTYPGAPEQCDGLDNDCDGIIDEDVGVDQDGDGFNACQGDCDDNDANVYPGAPVELCDGKDTDCDGIIPPIEVDQDFDGYLACEECDDTNAALNNDDLDADGFTTCDGDCDDTDPNLDIADLDQDGFTTCDGDCNDNDATLNLDDDDLDGFSSCTGDCDDGDTTVHPAATEVCDNGVDNDCDGVADDVDNDLDGYIDEACGGQDCDDANAAVNPDATEDCFDGVDNDCDGDVDDEDDDCATDDDTGDDDTGDDDLGDDDIGDDDTEGDDDTSDDPSDCECESNIGGATPLAPLATVLTLLGLVIVRRRTP